jgi:glycosyltransferase involved in cell wall biosynthesis
MHALSPQSARRRVLAVTSEPPWPLNSGGHIRTFYLLAALSREVDLRVVCPVQPNQRDVLAALETRGLDIRPVHVRARSALSEAHRLVGSFRRAEPYVMYRRHAWADVYPVLKSEVRQFDPDVLYLDHLDSMVYRDVAPDLPAAIDLHNVYSLLVRRSAEEQTSSWRAAFLRREARLLHSVEQRAATNGDTLFAVSAQEAGHFKTLGATRVHVVPNGVDCDLVSDLPTGRASAPTVLFLGAMSWAPNANAAKFLVDLLPALRQKVPDATILIVGRDAPPSLVALNALPGVEVTGAVADVKPYLLRGSVMAVPLDAGGGTRLKILEAFAAGLPVVSTSVGAEGIEATDGRDLIIAERPQFAGALAEILLSPIRSEQIATAARRLAREKYDWSRIGPAAAQFVSATSRDELNTHH